MVTWQTENCFLEAQRLASYLDLPLASKVGWDPNTPYHLHVTEERLEIVVNTKGKVSRISSEFVRGALGYRRRRGGGKTQAIARAVGLKKASEVLTVLDVTAGLGHDGFVLASLGCRVHLVERSPIIASLLLDGLKRAEEHVELQPIIRLIKVTLADAKEILPALLPSDTPDVIYLDPMFPIKHKSALAKVEMRVIREIVGDDTDADKLLSLALKTAKKRVVVKRPRHTPSLLLALPPSFVIEGKSSRYDIYLTRYNYSYD